MRILIAGLGSIGRRHLRNLKALGQRDLILLRSGMATLQDDSELAGLPVVTSIEQGLQMEPEAVIISNPTALHMQVAIPAARAGCHVLIEKPLSHNLERIDELRRAAAVTGARILIGYQFRFHPGLIALKTQLEQGRIGRLLFARAHWGEYLPAWHPWEDYHRSYAARADLGGGVVLTLCHPFDYMRWICGEVSQVSGNIAYSGALGIDVEDVAEASLVLQNGALATIHLDYLQMPRTHRVELVGTQGTMEWDEKLEGIKLYRDAAAGWEDEGSTPGFTRNDMFLAEMAHFFRVAKREEMPSCSLDDGIRALEIVQAVRRSAMTGRIEYA
jgi:predicted dehydrogenase